MPIEVLKIASGVQAGSLSNYITFAEGSPAADILVVTVQVVDSRPADRVVRSVYMEDNNGNLLKTLIHIATADKDDGEDFRTEIWYAVNVPANPGGGSRTPWIIIRMEGSCTDIGGGAIWMDGVDKDNPIEATQIGNDANIPPSISINTITPNAYVIDSLVSGESVGTKIGAVHTPIHVTDVGGDTTGSQYVDAGDGGSQTMNYTDTDSDTPWVMSAVAIKAFAPAVGGKSFGYII